MSRRLRPPKPPVISHPYIDNHLLASRKRHLAWVNYMGLGPFHPLPRKAKKAARKHCYELYFHYYRHAPAYYIDQLRKENQQ